MRRGMHLGRSAALASRGTDAEMIFVGSSLSSARQDGLRPGQRFASRTLLAGSENAGQHAVKLFDGKVFADVTVGAGPESGVNPCLVVADASEDNDGQGLAHFADERNEREPVHFRHVEIYDGNVAPVKFEPGRGFETLGEEFTSVTLLFEISDQELGDRGIIIDEEELDSIAGKDFHNWPCLELL